MSQTGVKAMAFEEVMGEPEILASKISDMYQEWEGFRQGWLAQRKEILEYVFATDTGNTANAELDWKNSTHIPKICQIRDNLHANYQAALFPNDKPIKWEGGDEEASTLEKRRVIESYMRNKMKMSKFRNTVSQLALDWIDYGNAFCTVEAVYEQREDPITGEMVSGYIGPKAVRISPSDIVFNPVAASFTESPKIVRSLHTLASLKTEIEDKPEKKYLEGVFSKVMKTRAKFRGHSEGDFVKDTEFIPAGFTSWFNYLESDYVEILDFYGDIFDESTDKIYKNVVISIVDRHYVLRHESNPTWLNHAPIFHVGWRIRPDNLVAQGPLDNLVGMQYRIDHLENAKADAFDLIIHPVMKIVGFVEDFEYGPGERIFVGEEGDVTFMPPDTTMLNADTQIAIYENKMEEMAGAPRQAMGFRTPGEKTKFEVQVLENGSNRVFLNKTSYFEEMFLEPILNAMLESARRNITQADLIRVVDDDTGAVEFLNITPEDLKSAGKITPVGARHFARDANMLQSLTELSNSALLQDEGVKNHISGVKIAKLVEELMGLEHLKLVTENIRISEGVASQRMLAAGQQILGEEGATANQEEQGGLQLNENDLAQRG
jgi:hypothetical protein